MLINDEKLILKEFIKGLNAAVKSMKNSLGMVFSGVTTVQKHSNSLSNDGDIQGLVVDDRLYTLKQQGKHARDLDLQMTALELAQKITHFRPELNIYILIAQEQEDEVVDALFSETVDGYFYREERDYHILNAQLQEKARTPFYDQLKHMC